MRVHYPYLNDTAFLDEIDSQQIAEYYIKITLLDWNENPIREVQGLATGGSLSVNGDSSARRTCSFTMVIKNDELANITNVNSLFSINKKAYLEVGLSNNTDEYTEYPIIWYPQGVYVINAASASHSASGMTLNLSFKDKMCLLDGSCGGTIPASTQFDEYETIDTNGNIIISNPTIVQIIREVVNHFGGEQIGRILISDVDSRAKMTMRWVGDSPIYLITEDGNNYFTTSYAEAKEKAYEKFVYGDDIGFIYTDLTYTKELIGDAGSTVTDILDNIVSFLGGNFEYFYDINGDFHFQEIKNYLNNTQAKDIISLLNNSKSTGAAFSNGEATLFNSNVEDDEVSIGENANAVVENTTINFKTTTSKNNYLIDISKGKSVYDFSNSKLLTSFSNSPQYNNIKNDYVIWGVRTTADGLTLPIRYHLAIDKKPKYGNIYNVFFYEDPDDGIVKAKMPTKYINYSHFPKAGAEGVFYMDSATSVIYIWDGENQTYLAVSGGPVLQYANKDAFPETGELGTIYVDLSTNKKYCWGIAEGSVHYKAVEEELEQAWIDYQAKFQPLNEQLNTVNATIKEEKIWIYTYGSEALITENLIEFEKEKSEYETKYEENEKIVEEDKVIVAGDEAEIDRLEEEYEKASEDQKPIIEEAIEEMKEKLETDKETLEKYKNVSTTLSEDIATLESKIDEYQIALDTFADHQTALDTANNTKEKVEKFLAEAKTEFSNAHAALIQKQYEYVETAIVEMENVKTTDWRSELYLQGVAAEPLGLESNYYYAELESEWPKIYNLRDTWNSEEDCWEGAFYEDVLENPSDMDYYLDFIDTTAAISDLSVNNIGRRSYIESSDDYNCMFEPDIPDYVIIESGQDDTEARRRECEQRDQKYIQVNSSIYDLIATGGLKNGLFPTIKTALYNYTSYNESIQIQGLPVYRLEPNTRITVKDLTSNIYGDYMINSISLPLTPNGTMSISATRAAEKL